MSPHAKGQEKGSERPPAEPFQLWGLETRCRAMLGKPGYFCLTVNEWGQVRHRCTMHQ